MGAETHGSHAIGKLFGPGQATIGRSAPPPGRHATHGGAIDWPRPPGRSIFAGHALPARSPRRL